jgi:hypothetical protein
MTDLSTPIPAPPPPPLPSRRERRWVPVIAVAAVLFVVVVGGSITEDALAKSRQPPVGVAGLVSVRPLSGWEFAGRANVKGIPDLRLTRGNGNLDVLVTTFPGGDESLVRAYLHDIVAPQARQLQVSATFERVEIGHGRVASRARYIGLFGDRASPIEGDVTGLIVDGHAILFDGWAPAGVYEYVRDDVHHMIDDARIG